MQRLNILISKLFVSSLLFASIQHNAHAKKISLEEFLKEVKTVNPAIEAARFRALSLEHKVLPSKTLEDPFIAAGIDEIPFEGGSAGLRRYQVSQSFPFPGKLKAKGEIANKRAESGKFDAETLSRQLEVFSTQTYLRALFNEENLSSNQKIQTILEEISASAKARYKTGDNTHHEWLLAKLELATLKVEALRIERTQKSLIALLNELMNKSPNEPIELDDTPLEVKTEEELTFDLETQPEVQGLRAYKNAADTELRLAKLSYAPDFVIQGMAMEPTSKNMNQQMSNWGVMVGVTVPLYFWRKQSEFVESAEKERLAAMMELKRLENRLNTEITDAKLQYQTSKDVLQLYKNDVIPLTEIAVKNARASYAAKTLPLRQLLEALKTKRIQDLEFLASKIDVSVASLRVNKLLSDPPLLKLTPTRPTSFGSDMSSNMGPTSEMGGSATINMGSGMSGPTRKQNETTEPSSSGMGSM